MLLQSLQLKSFCYSEKLRLKMLQGFGRGS